MQWWAHRKYDHGGVGWCNVFASAGGGALEGGVAVLHFVDVRWFVIPETLSRRAKLKLSVDMDNAKYGYW